MIESISADRVEVLIRRPHAAQSTRRGIVWLLERVVIFLPICLLWGAILLTAWSSFR